MAPHQPVEFRRRDVPGPASGCGIAGLGLMLAILAFILVDGFCRQSWAWPRGLSVPAGAATGLAIASGLMTWNTRLNRRMRADVLRVDGRGLSGAIDGRSISLEHASIRVLDFREPTRTSDAKLGVGWEGGTIVFDGRTWPVEAVHDALRLQAAEPVAALLLGQLARDENAPFVEPSWRTAGLSATQEGLVDLGRRTSIPWREVRAVVVDAAEIRVEGRPGERPFRLSHRATDAAAFPALVRTLAGPEVEWIELEPRGPFRGRIFGSLTVREGIEWLRLSAWNGWARMSWLSFVAGLASYDWFLSLGGDAVRVALGLFALAAAPFAFRSRVLVADRSSRTLEVHSAAFGIPVRSRSIDVPRDARVRITSREVLLREGNLVQILFAVLPFLASSMLSLLARATAKRRRTVWRLAVLDGEGDVLAEVVVRGEKHARRAARALRDVLGASRGG